MNILEMIAKIENGIKNNIWVTARGEEIPLEKMSDNHLKNSLNMLKEGRLKNKYYIPYIELLEKEIKKRKI